MALTESQFMSEAIPVISYVMTRLSLAETRADRSVLIFVNSAFVSRLLMLRREIARSLLAERHGVLFDAAGADTTQATLLAVMATVQQRASAAGAIAAEDLDLLQQRHSVLIPSGIPDQAIIQSIQSIGDDVCLRYVESVAYQSKLSGVASSVLSEASRASVYQGAIGINSKIQKNSKRLAEAARPVLEVQQAVVRWLATLTYCIRKQEFFVSTENLDGKEKAVQDLLAQIKTTGSEVSHVAYTEITSYMQPYLL